MRYGSVLLVNFYYPESGYGERLLYPPIGLGYLSEYLETHGVRTAVVDMGTGKDMALAEEFVSRSIEGSRPQLIAISLNSICFSRSIEVIGNVRKRYPEIPIAVGGPHASSKGAELLKRYGFLDYVVVREGEKALFSLCSGELPGNVAGLCWRQGSEVRQNPDAQSSDLSEFPFPRYERFQLDSYGDPSVIGILTSRGCPYGCIFCQQSSLLGKRWRGRAPESIIEEVRYWRSKGKKSIHILDDNFGMDHGRALRVSDMILEEGLNDVDFVIVGGLRINQTDEGLLLALKRMGVRVIPFGIESGSNKVLKFIRKGITAEQADRVIGLAVGMGFEVKLFFIIGFPTETMEDVQMSLDLALKHRIASARFFNLVPYADTPLMEWLQKNSARFNYGYDEYMADFKRFQRIPIFECPGGMSAEEKRKALGLADEAVRKIEERYRSRNV